MERYETESLSAVLWEHERAAKEKLEAGYDPVVMIRVVEWSGICWAYDRLSESEGASDPRHELMGWMLVQDALRDDESVRWRVHQDALGLIMDSFGVQGWHRSDRTVSYDWPNGMPHVETNARTMMNAICGGAWNVHCAPCPTMARGRSLWPATWDCRPI